MPSDNREVVWTTAWSVGLYRLDEQHKKIIDTFNKLQAAVDARVDSEIVSDTLNKLTLYACEHFRDEEELMEQVSYPGIEEHRKEHQQFREKIAQCCVATSFRVESVPKELLTYLNHWLNQHFLVQDMKYQRFIAARRVK